MVTAHREHLSNGKVNYCTTTGERLGLFDKETNQYYFYTSAFSDVCNPFSKKQVLSILDNKKLLIKNNGNRPSYRLRVDKDNIKSFYCVNGDILNSEMAI